MLITFIDLKYRTRSTIWTIELYDASSTRIPVNALSSNITFGIAAQVNLSSSQPVCQYWDKINLIWSQVNTFSLLVLCKNQLKNNHLMTDRKAVLTKLSSAPVHGYSVLAVISHPSVSLIVI